MAKVSFKSAATTLRHPDVVLNNRRLLLAAIRAARFDTPRVFLFGPLVGKELRAGEVRDLESYGAALTKAMCDGRCGRMLPHEWTAARSHAQEVHTATCHAIGLGEDDWPDDGTPAYEAFATGRVFGDS